MRKSIDELMQDLVCFRDERDWEQFHTPKNLAVSLSIEVAELLECFQWKTDEEVAAMLKGAERIKVQEELADIAAYLLLLCDGMDVDLAEAMADKLEKNKMKYPVEKCRGKADKYTEL